MKTGSGMVEYARQYLGTPYFYGSKIPEGILTENKMKIMHAMYPGIVTDSYMTKARSRGQVGRVNVDCSGLIAGYRQKNIGSAQLYQTAYTRMPIARLSDFAPGVVLWRPGHVGVYAGNVEGRPGCKSLQRTAGDRHQCHTGPEERNSELSVAGRGGKVAAMGTG